MCMNIFLYLHYVNQYVLPIFYVKTGAYNYTVNRTVYICPSGPKPHCLLNASMQVLVNTTCEFLGSVAPLMSCLFIEVLSPSVHTPLCFNIALGADSNSEYSSGSGVLLSDSRETSPADSCVHDGGDRGDRGTTSGETSFKELDWEQTGGQQQAGREEELHSDHHQKSPEAPVQEWWGVAGEE